MISASLTLPFFVFLDCILCEDTNFRYNSQFLTDLIFKQI